MSTFYNGITVGNIINASKINTSVIDFTGPELKIGQNSDVVSIPTLQLGRLLISEGITLPETVSINSSNVPLTNINNTFLNPNTFTSSLTAPNLSSTNISTSLLNSMNVSSKNISSINFSTTNIVVTDTITLPTRSISDNALSLNVPLLNTTNIFTQPTTFSNDVFAPNLSSTNINSSNFSSSNCSIDRFVVTGTITLPARSIADGALSTNVALQGSSNTFSQPTTFTQLTTFLNAVSAPNLSSTNINSSNFSSSNCSIDRFVVTGTITLPSRSIADDALSTNVALQGSSNTFSQPTTFTQLTTFSNAVSAPNLSSTNINSSNFSSSNCSIDRFVVTGTINLPSRSIADGALSTNVALQGSSNTFSQPTTFTQLTTFSNAVSAPNLSSTNINSSNFSSSNCSIDRFVVTGTITLPSRSIVDGALSTNVALQGSSNTFSQPTTFSNSVSAPNLSSTNINSSNFSSSNCSIDRFVVTGSITLPSNSILDGALSTNIPLLNTANTFTQNTIFSTLVNTPNISTSNISTNRIYSDTSIFASNFDTYTLTNLNVGNTSAQTINIGNSGSTTNITGSFNINGTPYASGGGGGTTITGGGTIYTSNMTNVSLGYQALNVVSSINTNNTGIGHQALSSVTTGLGNTTVGYTTGTSITGDYNSGFGFNALSATTTGSYNIGLGYGAGPNTGALNKTISVGMNTSSTKNSQILIGNTTEYSECDIMVSGNTGINTTSPSFKLHVNGDGAFNSNLNVNNDALGTAPFLKVSPSTNAAESSLAFYQNTANSGTSWKLGHNLNSAGSDTFGLYSSTLASNAITVLNTGATGIATASPSFKLHVNGDGAFNSNLNVNNNANGTAPFLKVSPSTNAAESSMAFYQNTANSGSFWKVGHNINSAGSDTYSIYSSTLSNNAMTVLSNGNVGMNTTSPSYKLHVNGEGGFNGNLNVNNNALGTAPMARTAPNTNTGEASIGFYQNTANGGASWKIGHNINSAGSDTLSLYSSTLASNAMTVLNTGSIGIATTSPSYKLHVNGTGGFNSNVDVNANALGTAPLLKVSPSTAAGESSIAFYQNTANGGASWKVGHNINTAGTDTFNLYSSTLASNAITVLNTGNVGIATTSPAYKLQVNGTFAATSVNTTSDYRIKNNVQDISNTIYDAFDCFDKLRPVYYHNTQSKSNDFGFIAHELQSIYPDLVNGVKDSENLQTINYIGLIPICINEIQKLKQQNLELQQKINEIFDRI